MLPFVVCAQIVNINTTVKMKLLLPLLMHLSTVTAFLSSGSTLGRSKVTVFGREQRRHASSNPWTMDEPAPEVGLLSTRIVQQSALYQYALFVMSRHTASSRMQFWLELSFTKTILTFGCSCLFNIPFLLADLTLLFILPPWLGGHWLFCIPLFPACAHDFSFTQKQ